MCYVAKGVEGTQKGRLTARAMRRPFVYINCSKDQQTTYSVYTMRSSVELWTVELWTFARTHKKGLKQLKVIKNI